MTYNPAERRDAHGRWTSGELHALNQWVNGRGGVRRIQHGALASDFQSALSKLPTSEGDLWRGVKGAGADRHASLNPGDTVHWSVPRSTSTDPRQAFGFGTNLYRIQGSKGKVLSGEGLPNAYEKEAVLPPGDYEVVSRDDTAKIRVGGKHWPVSIVTLRPKKPTVDLANPSHGVKRRERPVVKHTVPAPIDHDTTVRHIAAILSASSRFKRLHGDFGQEVDGLAHYLSPYGIRKRAVRIALGLAYKEGGGQRGTSHVPNARLAEHGATLTDEVRGVRDAEVYFRAAYLANAAQRIQTSLNHGATEREALRREAPYYRLHEEARRGRLTAVAQVQHAAKMFGQNDGRGTLVGWYLNPLLKNEVECITANGHNFYAEEGTVIGLPGSVHNRCGCYAGPPHSGASMVNDVLGNVVRFGKARPKFKLKTRRTA